MSKNKTSVLISLWWRLILPRNKRFLRRLENISNSRHDPQPVQLQLPFPSFRLFLRCFSTSVSRLIHQLKKLFLLRTGNGIRNQISIHYLHFFQKVSIVFRSSRIFEPDSLTFTNRISSFPNVWVASGLETKLCQKCSRVVGEGEIMNTHRCAVSKKISVNKKKHSCWILFSLFSYPNSYSKNLSLNHWYAVFFPFLVFPPWSTLSIFFTTAFPFPS